MSHFVTHVFVPSGVEDLSAYLDDVLAPYDEGKEVEHYIDNFCSDEELAKNRESEYATEIKDLPDEEFLREWGGREKVTRNDEKGGWDLWTNYNPESRWDWWTIGGRWDNFFNFDPSSPEQERDTWGPATGRNIIKVGELDWQKIRDQKMKEAHKAYDDFEEATAGLTLDHKWKDLCDKVEAQELDPGEARELYSSQEWVIATRNLGLFMLAGPEDYFKVNDGGRDAFVSDGIFSVGVPYAFVDLAGAWHQKGEMGWFGISSGDKDQVEWAEYYFNYVTKQDSENLIVTLDLHI